jgi:hypothetical protein
MGLLGSVRSSVSEINRKYARPEIEMTLFTKICLVGLRVYLLLMVVLMVYSLVHTAATGGDAVDTAPSPPAPVSPLQPPSATE